MGTARPRVRIEAATLAGSDNNQDRYAYGDGWAFVLDGATSYSDTPPVHDGGWYAERLKNALAPRLTRHPERPTVDIVADSIREAASAHHPSQGPCPTSTIALARWDAAQVELYVLGDSYACALTDDGPVILTDDRLSKIGVGLRTLYRQRLRQGHGFDDRHREILRALQQVELAHRNRSGGYWIAGADPLAAPMAHIRTLATRSINLALATDGISYHACKAELMDESFSASLWVNYAHCLDVYDAGATRRPRGKPSDDKTLLLVRQFQR